MKKKIFAVTMVVALLGSGAAFAGAHHHMGPGGGGARRGAYASDFSWIEQAPKNIQDAFKQMDINRSEMRLEIAKGNTDSKKLTPLHNNILKARRTVADHYFDQALKNPGQAGMFMDGRYHHMGMRMMGGSFSGGLFSDLRSELSKANPNATRAKQIYTDMMNLSEKQAKERFELMLKYPESMSERHRVCVF